MCAKNEAKYTCPRCEVKTCCLECVKIHKKELDCNGLRDKVKFKRLKNFDNIDLLNGNIIQNAILCNMFYLYIKLPFVSVIVLNMTYCLQLFCVHHPFYLGPRLFRSGWILFGSSRSCF